MREIEQVTHNSPASGLADNCRDSCPLSILIGLGCVPSEHNWLQPLRQHEPGFFLRECAYQPKCPTCLAC